MTNLTEKQFENGCNPKDQIKYPRKTEDCLLRNSYRFIINKKWFSDCSHFQTRSACISTGFITKRGTDECFVTCVGPSPEEPEVLVVTGETTLAQSVFTRIANKGRQFIKDVSDWWN